MQQSSLTILPQTTSAIQTGIAKGLHTSVGAETVPYGFGRFCSEGTFGHGGAQSSIGFADPKHDLVVAWVANVRAGEGHIRSETTRSTRRFTKTSA